jgi:hypothetical protein
MVAVRRTIMTYIIPRTLKHETKIFKRLYIKDLAFIGLFLSLAYFFKGMVHAYMQIPYWLFTFIFSFYMVTRPKCNPKKYKFQSILMYLFRDNSTYHSLNHVRKGEQDMSTTRKNGKGNIEKRVNLQK